LFSLRRSDVLAFGRLWHGEPNAVTTIDYAHHRSRSQNAVIRICDDPGKVVESQGDFKKW